MTTEELLAVRYKVIADYPGNTFPVDTVFKHPGNPSMDNFFKDKEKYPHLFKKLEWWEEREISDLPEYVKWNYMPNVDDKSMEGYVVKVKGWSQAFYAVETITGEVTATKYWLPSTEQEYLEYQSKVKKPHNERGSDFFSEPFFPGM